MSKKIKLKLGDVFTIPLTDIEVGFGQAITNPRKISGGFIIAVYNLKSIIKENYEICNLLGDPPLFLGHTFDALIVDLPKWKIFDNCVENINNIVLPYHRLGSPPDDIYLTDHSSKVLAEISESTFDTLSYKSEIAPIRYENALKAHFGLKDWIEDDYDKILYKHALDSNKIANKILSRN